MNAEAESLEARWARCRWPRLEEPYSTALREAVRFILEHVPDLLGILVSGTIVRGKPAASSDLDIYVLRSEPYRQRVQRWFNQVPAEIFINPPAQVRRYFAEERHSARPITAHMLATGFTILELTPVLSELRREAGREVSTPPHPNEQQLTSARYMAALRYEDALDMAAACPPTANMILCAAVHDMLTYRFQSAGRYIPRDKDLLIALEVLDQELAALARAFYLATSLLMRLDLAAEIAARTIKVQGFFPWESTPEKVG